MGGDLNIVCVAKHPSASLGKARKALREGAFEEAAEALRELAGKGSATEIALTEALRINSQMTPEEQIRRAADALVRAYLPESWERVIAEARRLEQSSSQPDFARAVRIEVERRHNEQEIG